MIPVTKTYLPPLEEYNKYLEEIWESGWITNNAQFSQLLEDKLANYLDVPDLQLVSSGTIALQIAIRVLELEGEVITTPFSYVATTSSILWENCSPKYVDINPDTLTIDPDKIEDAVTEDSSAILATHIFGIPCDVEAIERIADKHDLKVIYDAAHAFGVRYKGRSLTDYGDISALSFHGTKLFHTAEGGGLVTRDLQLAEKISLSRSFGHEGDEHYRLGINGKNSELHAALGLCVLPRVKGFIQKRKEVYELYRSLLKEDNISYPSISEDIEYNYSYFPVIFESEQTVKKVQYDLKKESIDSRRYFYPSLNELDYIGGSPQECTISEDISRRILCLPLFKDLEKEDVAKISDIVNEVTA